MMVGTEHWWNDADRRKQTLDSATFPTTNLALTDLGSNAGLHRDRAASKHLNHDTAIRRKLNRMIFKDPVHTSQ